MEKDIKKINEAQLKDIIAESVNKVINEGLFGPSKKELARRERERQRRLAQYQAEQDAKDREWRRQGQIAHPDWEMFYTPTEWEERQQRLAQNAEEKRWLDKQAAIERRQQQARDEEYANKVRAFKPEPYYKVYDRSGKQVGSYSDERAAQNNAHSIGGTYELAYTELNENYYPRPNSQSPIEEELTQIEAAYESICEKAERGIVEVNNDAMKMIYKGMYMLGL